MAKHNWKKLSKRARKMVDENGPFETLVELFQALDVPRTSLQSAIERGEFPDDLITDGDNDGVTYSTNSAVATYERAEQLTAEDVIKLGGIDMEVYYLDDIEHTAWTTTRKDKRTRIEYGDNGIEAGSFTEDTGELVSKYNWRTKATFKRRKPVAVQPTLQPVVFNVINTPPIKVVETRPPSDVTKVLFFSDTHVGYVDGEYIHDRPFMGTLLTIAAWVKPDITVHAGDGLDLAGFSSFAKTPGQMFSLQKSAIEFSWWLSRMRMYTLDDFYLLQGNHDERMDRVIAQDAAEAYEVRPVNDLDGWPLMSVPRLLNLDALRIRWVGEYRKDNFITIGKAKFIHGSKSNQGTGKTMSNLANRSPYSLFYGHTHRPEGGWGRDEFSNQPIFIGCPGGCCTKRVPGAKYSSNWKSGAYVIYIDNESGHVKHVEHIQVEDDGTTWFRGEILKPMDYTADLNRDIDNPKYVF